MMPWIGETAFCTCCFPIFHAVSTLMGPAHPCCVTQTTQPHPVTPVLNPVTCMRLQHITQKGIPSGCELNKGKSIQRAGHEAMGTEVDPDCLLAAPLWPCLTRALCKGSGQTLAFAQLWSPKRAAHPSFPQLQCPAAVLTPCSSAHP